MSDEPNGVGLSIGNDAASGTFADALRAYTADLTANFAALIEAQPEDQLKAPVGALLRAAGEAAGAKVRYRTEVRVDGVAGRPDLGIDADGLPVGSIELKQPGKGARPEIYSDKHSKGQFERFKKLPNLLYTDGREWSLFRSGERHGEVVSLPFDPTSASPSEVTPNAANSLLELLGQFLGWEPVVPSTPRALADMLAPLTRVLRDEVLADVHNDGVMSRLAEQWRDTLFPDANDRAFADGYAQTFTYALLLARLEGAEAPINADTAARALDDDHALLAQVLRVLGQPGARDAIGMPVGLLERIIGAVDAAKLAAGQDLWLYFYEDFLAAYDPDQRNNRGVYYTPFDIVDAQVRLCQHILTDRLDLNRGFGDPSVVVLDPAAGTGTYPLTIAKRVLDEATARGGEGLRGETASKLVSNLNAFELLVGPYAVTHLRLSRMLADAGATVPGDGVKVFLTDTLAAPTAEGFAGQAHLFEERLAIEQERASRVKGPRTEVTVVIGNPPYDRDTSGYNAQGKRKGGMVRHGAKDGEVGLLGDFLEPLSTADRQSHALNLYNDYVYFWRWAIWKTCEQNANPSITCFITAASYLTGPGYGGMREVMRHHFDEIWIIDLGGEGHGALKEDNVFDGVLTPVAITVAVRRPTGEYSVNPAVVRYRQIDGTRKQKLQALSEISSLDDDEQWEVASAGLQDPFMPPASAAFAARPKLIDLFGWTARGIQFSRSWPVAETQDLALQRWRTLVSATPADRAALLRETRDAQVQKGYLSHRSSVTLSPIADLDSHSPPDDLARVAFRSFDRRWAIADRRAIDMPRPPLWTTATESQIFFTSFVAPNGLTVGPALVANLDVPDLNAFNNRGGIVLPLLRSDGSNEPNVTESTLAALGAAVGSEVQVHDACAYIFGLLGTGAYVARFQEELKRSTPTVPFTSVPDLFWEVVSFGRDLLWWATFGERFQPVNDAGKATSQLPSGVAKNTRAVSGSPDRYPEDWLCCRFRGSVS